MAAYGATLATMVLSLGSAALLTRTLSGEEYGVWSQFRIVSGLVMTGLSLNLGHGFLRFGAGASPERRGVIFSHIVGVQVALVLLGLLVVLPFADTLGELAFGRPGLSLWLGVGAWALVTLVQVQLVNSLLMQSKAPRAYGLLSAYRILTLVAFAALFVWPRVEVAVIVSVSMLLCVAVALGVSARNELRWPRLGLGPIRELLLFCLPLLPVQLAMWVVASSDRFFIKHYAGLEEVGRYALVYTFALLIPTIYAAVSGIFMTAIVRWYEGEEYERVGAAVSWALRAYVAVGGAMLLGLFVGARPIITWLSKAEYAFDGVEEVALAVGAGGFLFGLFQILTRLYDLAKRPWIISAIWVSAMVLNLILNALWIPSMGAMGAALATAVSYATTFALAWALRPREVSLHTSIVPMALYLAGLAGLGWVAGRILEPESGLVAIFSVAIAGGAVALLWSWACRLVIPSAIRLELARRDPGGS
jgi:O-antigen/teichoic acid export membrane protein